MQGNLSIVQNDFRQMFDNKAITNILLYHTIDEETSDITQKLSS